jgi:PhnB protein
MHAQVKIGDSVLMMGQSGENNPALQCILYLYLEDTDATYKQAIAGGAVSLQEPTDTFYGDRTAGVRDAFGNQWWMATRIEEVTRDEMIQRAASQT